MVQNTTFLWVIFVLGRPLMITCFSNGASRNSCVTLSPSDGHAGQAISYPLRHRILLGEGVTTYTPGQHIRVHIISTNSKFVGLFVQARPIRNFYDPLPVPAVGRFAFPDPWTNLRAMECWKLADSITQATPYMDLQNVTMRWVPPSRDAGNIVFVATVMTDGKTWYAPIKSAILRYRPPTLSTARPTPVVITATGGINGCSTGTSNGWTCLLSLLLLVLLGSWSQR